MTHPKTRSGASPERHPPNDLQAPEHAEFRAVEAAATGELRLPVDAHMIGEPVAVTRVYSTGLPRVGLLASVQREQRTYDVNLSDVVFPAGSAGARFVARYRAWLGLPSETEERRSVEPARPHKVGGDDITVGDPVELIVVACKSNALRCKLLGSAREVTLRTAVRDEIPGSIITVTPRKQWTHARHPYLSGDVSAVRIDAAALGLVPLLLHRVGDGECPAYRMEQASDASAADLLFEAGACIEEEDYVEADELLTQVLALDLRVLEAHAMLGERALRHMPSLALHHFELGVAIGSLSIGEDFDGVLPWGLLDNRPFLRCLHGLACALHRLGRADAAASAFSRLLRLDPADPFSIRASSTAGEAVPMRRETEGGA